MWSEIVAIYRASKKKQDINWFTELVGLAGLFCLASGIALTSFMRRPEYGAKQMTDDGQPAEVGGRKGAIGLALSGIEWAARFVVHYPQYIWICALANRLDIFFWAY